MLYDTISAACVSQVDVAKVSITTSQSLPLADSYLLNVPFYHPGRDK